VWIHEANNRLLLNCKLARPRCSLGTPTLSRPGCRLGSPYPVTTSLPCRHVGENRNASMVDGQSRVLFSNLASPASGNPLQALPSVLPPHPSAAVFKPTQHFLFEPFFGLFALQRGVFMANSYLQRSCFAVFRLARPTAALLLLSFTPDPAKLGAGVLHGTALLPFRTRCGFG
jgi:hypothetical protein